MQGGDVDAMGMYQAGAGQQGPRHYRKKKAWPLRLNITIETPDLETTKNESF
jgi:hypothetical protein